MVRGQHGSQLLLLRDFMLSGVPKVHYDEGSYN